MMVGTAARVRRGIVDERLFIAAVLSAYAIVVSIVSLHHAMWRDELQAWLIARESGSPAELLHNLKYEASPGLWHACLYVIARFTHDPSAMKILHLTLAVGAAYIFMRFAPFSRTHRALWCLGYFPLFEYAVINRSYVLGVLFTFAFCALVSQRRTYPECSSLALALAANSSAAGLVVSLALAPVLVARLCSPNAAMAPRWRLRLAAGIVSAGSAAAFVQISPPGRRLIGSSVVAPHRISEHFVQALNQIWKGYVPIPNFLGAHWWNTNISMLVRHGSVPAAVMSLVLLGASCALFWDTRVVLLSYLLGMLGVMCLGYLYSSVVRQAGFTFVLFVACAWLRRTLLDLDIVRSPSQVRRTIDARTGAALTALFAVQAVAAAIALVLAARAPFSASREVADFIVRRHLAALTIAGTSEADLFPLSAYLTKPVYALQNHQFVTFAVWDRPPTVASDAEAIAGIRRLLRVNRRVILVTATPFTSASRALSACPLAAFTNATGTFESYYLYIVVRSKVTSQPCRRA